MDLSGKFADLKQSEQRRSALPQPGLADLRPGGTGGKWRKFRRIRPFFTPGSWLPFPLPQSLQCPANREVFLLQTGFFFLLFGA